MITTSRPIQSEADTARIRSIVERASNESSPFAKMIQHIRIGIRPQYRYDQVRGIIYEISDGLTDNEREVIKRCEDSIVEINKRALKEINEVQLACVEGHSTHASEQVTKPTIGKESKTPLGFSILHFRDSNGIECSLQQSSAVDNTDLGRMVPGSSYVWLGNLTQDRMHISREQAQFLIYHLDCWLRTGSLTESTERSS